MSDGKKEEGLAVPTQLVRREQLERAEPKRKLRPDQVRVHVCVDCVNCDGNGYKSGGLKCETCHGDGHVHTEVSLAELKELLSA